MSDHHVKVKEGGGHLRPQTFDEGVAKGQVGDEMSIHNVQMEIVRTRSEESTALYSNPGEVSVEDGGSYAAEGRHCGALVNCLSRREIIG